MKRDKESATLAAMRRAGVPLDRQTYIWMSLCELDGDDELDWELEEMLPSEISRFALDELLTDKIR